MVFSDGPRIFDSNNVHKLWKVWFTTVGSVEITVVSSVLSANLDMDQRTINPELINAEVRRCLFMFFFFLPLSRCSVALPEFAFAVEFESSLS